MANNQLDLGKVSAVEGEDLSVLEHVIYNSEKDQLDSDKPLVEAMSGYSAQLRTPDNVTIENVFCGIVKNGNKLTIVHAFNLTRTAEGYAGGWASYYNYPASVGAKLYPAQIGQYGWLACGIADAFKDTGLANHKDMSYSLLKTSDTQSTLAIDCSNLELNTKYYCRIEMTFLLSDNLIQ